MTLYAKDKSFSAGWVFGGAIVMFIANFFAGLVMAGFFIGWRSEGQTIIEAGLAAVVATGASVAILTIRTGGGINPLAMMVGSIPPFVAGLIGGFIGEKVQGDSVEVQD